MKKFSDFKIKVETSAFEGNKIKINKVLNRKIIICSYKIVDSKFNTGKCLYIQIEFNGSKNVVFTGSKGLIDAIQKVPVGGFPFEATIIQENEMYFFT